MRIIYAFFLISSLGPLIRFRKNEYFYFFFFSLLTDSMVLLQMKFFRSSIYNIDFYILGNLLIVLSLPRISKKYKYGLILFILLYFIIERSDISGMVSMIFIMLFILIHFTNTLVQEIRIDGKIRLFLPFMMILYFVGIVLAYYFYADIKFVQIAFIPKIILYTLLYWLVIIFGPDRKINFTFGYDPTLKAKMANDLNIHVDEYDNYLAKGLSHREIQIYHLIKMGMNNKEIAEKLNIEKKTVETHMQNMKVKFGFNSMTELRDFVKKADGINVPIQE